MTVPKLRMLACVALGAALGILAATWDSRPTLKAAPVAPPVAESVSSDEEPDCCGEGMCRQKLLSEASPKVK